MNDTFLESTVVPQVLRLASRVVVQMFEDKGEQITLDQVMSWLYMKTVDLNGCTLQVATHFSVPTTSSFDGFAMHIIFDDVPVELQEADWVWKPAKATFSFPVPPSSAECTVTFDDSEAIEIDWSEVERVFAE